MAKCYVCGEEIEEDLVEDGSEVCAECIADDRDERDEEE